MRFPRYSEQDVRLEAERFVKYRGTARVPLHLLCFERGELRDLNRRNVERLKTVFHSETVRRLDPRNRVPAVISQSGLDEAVAASGISAERLLNDADNDPPALHFPAGVQLTCLHGRHRVQAARETLPPTDAWWAVDLYLAGRRTSHLTLLLTRPQTPIQLSGQRSLKNMPTKRGLLTDRSIARSVNMRGSVTSGLRTGGRPAFPTTAEGVCGSSTITIRSSRPSTICSAYRGCGRV